jgi:drug/metabolite transporter (DMT)-like permease
MTRLHRLRSASSTLKFLAMGIIWGASFLFIKIALEGVSFGQVAWARIVLGASVLAIVFIASRGKLPREPIMWLHFVVLAVANCVLPYLLFAWAEQYVTSSLASIYNAVTPLTTALLATAVFRVDRLRSLQVVGLLVGVAGVLVIVAPWKPDSLVGTLPGQLACLGAVTLYGIAYGYTRRFVTPHGLPGLTLATLNIGVAAVIMLVLTPWVAVGPVDLDWRIIGSLVLLGALGTGFAYIWHFDVLRDWGATRSSTVTYVTPVVGVVLGVTILGEQLSWNEPVGALLVFAGILFTQQRLSFGRRPGEVVDTVVPETVVEDAVALPGNRAPQKAADH